jgi:peroxiredoxin
MSKGDLVARNASRGSRFGVVRKVALLVAVVLVGGGLSIPRFFHHTQAGDTSNGTGAQEWGPPAPNFQLSATAGQLPRGLDELWAEKPVVLVFFSSWCDQCANAQSGLNKLAKRYENKIAFVGIAGKDTEADVAQYVKKHGVRYEVRLDTTGQFFEKYAVREPPLIALVSKGGRLLRGWPGGLGADELEKQLKNLVL